MAAIINTNLQSMNAQRNLSKSQATLSTAMQRLSSGLRINSAKDDAAGLAISERMTTQTRGLTVAARNANDGISLAQTAEGALGSITSNLQRIRELAVQSRNATNNADDRAALNEEVQQLMEEVNRIARDTTFNGTNLLDGSFTNMAFQVGANQSQTIDVTSIVNANTDALGKWESVNTPSSILAAKPAGSAIVTPSINNLAVSPVAGGDGGTPALPTLTLEFEIGGTLTPIKGTGQTETDTAGALADLISKVAAQNFGTEIEATLNASGTSIEFKNTSTTAVTNVKYATVAVALPAGTSEVGLGEYKVAINGATIEVPAAKTPEQRANQLAAAINESANLSPAPNPAIFAKIIDGRLQVLSSGGEVSVNFVAPGTAADIKAQTGLVVGSSAAGAITDTDLSVSAFVASKEEVGFSSLNVLDEYSSDNAILAMDAALAAVNSARATLGAVQSRFESTIENLNIANENLTASKSRIMDADFAAETARLSSAQVLQQAGTAMVAQANQIPQGVLQLLQG